jgi:hypothetical protein
LRDYGTTLYHCAVSILRTLEKGYSGYKFPIGQDQTAAAEHLLAVLNGAPGNPSEAFHSFIKPILFASQQQMMMMEHSKWNDMLECLLAILCVQEDGNFRQPHDITQFFAHFIYAIRGAVIYEGALQLGDYNNDLYK